MSLAPRVLRRCASAAVLLFVGCHDGHDDAGAGSGGTDAGRSAIVADHLACAAFAGLSAGDIAQASSRFSGRIFYGHTSHGSQIVTGLRMLQFEHAACPAPAVGPA